MHRSTISRARGVMAVGLLAALSACVPYAVATTAEPVLPDSTRRTMVTTVMPPVAPFGSDRGSSFLTIDTDVRRGIDSVSDAGFRLVGMSGLVVTYKRLLTGPDAPALIAVMPGFGIVNVGNHAHFELTMLVSPRSTRTATDSQPAAHARFVPYGGWRIMQVAPLSSNAVHDRPSIGGFIGLRIGTATLGISPELGVFHDPSALGVRDNPIVVIPSIAVHGDELIDMIRGRPSGPRGPRPLPRPRPFPRLPR